MCVLTIGSFSLVCKVVKIMVNTRVASWFVGFSLIWDFSVYFNYSSRITFWGGGPLPGPLGARGNMYRIGVGDHFQVLKVSGGT